MIFERPKSTTSLKKVMCAKMPFFLATGQSTVCRLRDFSVTQILREFNFGGSRSSKIAVLAILGVLNFVDLVHFSLQNSKSHKSHNSEYLNLLKQQILKLYICQFPVLPTHSVEKSRFLCPSDFT